jgi:hypothetical protein
MKKLVILSLFSLILFSACKKEDEKEITLEEYLVGKWKLYETDNSTGVELGFYFKEDHTLYVYSDLDFSNPNKTYFDWNLVAEQKIIITLKENNPNGNPDIFDDLQINFPKSIIIRGWNKDDPIIHVGIDNVNYNLEKL